MKSSLSASQTNAISHLGEWKVGALFMEAGTGKTRVAIDLIEQTPCDLCVWVCPLRTIDNARAEFEKWGCKMPVHFVGVESIGQSERIYLEVVQIVESAQCPFIVVDESLKIKNMMAKRTKRLLALGRKAEYKLILNGTPLSKNLLDIYTQMQFLSPKILNMGFARFKNTFCTYKRLTDYHGRGAYTREIITGYANIDYLMSLLREYIFQAELSLDVTQNFSEQTVQVDAGTCEEYARIKKDFLRYESLMKMNNNIFLAMTQKMQHSYCCAPAKIDALREILKKESQAETIIFCKFIDSQREVQQAFPDVKVLSYQRESLGLNLQDYNVMVFFDKTFDYAQRLQATRRVYRIGQKNDCRYYDITCNFGLEGMMNHCIRRKMTLLEYFKSKSMEEIKEEL